MSISKALSDSAENSIIAMVLRRGYPVVEEGKENPRLAEHGFGFAAWKDTVTDAHVKGGATYDEHNRRWVSYDGCKWDFQDAVLTKDDLGGSADKVTLEVEGLVCNCGQYSSQRVRYIGEKKVVLAEVTRKMQEAILAL